MALPVNGSTHLIPAYYSFYRPRRDERLSWPSWLTYSGWLTHISGHPSAAGRAQDRESLPARDRRSTTVPRHQQELNYVAVILNFCTSKCAIGLFVVSGPGSVALRDHAQAVTGSSSSCVRACAVRSSTSPRLSRRLGRASGGRRQQSASLAAGSTAAVLVPLSAAIPTRARRHNTVSDGVVAAGRLKRLRQRF